jgi:hypothetical protein
MAVFIIFYALVLFGCHFVKHGELLEIRRTIYHTSYHTFPIRFVDYSEGHRLLDGSVKFADELARLVLRMSDLSGSNVVSGFEEYLTGYRNVESARQTISKLFRSPLNRLGEDILAGMVEAMNSVIAVAVTEEQPQFLPMLFRAKPELGVSPELWVAAGDRKRELFESLISHPKLGEELTQGIGLALLESDSEFLLKRALETWGQPVVFGVLDWITKGNGPLSDRSLGALTFHVESIAKWILAHEDAPQRVIISAAHIIAPFTYQFRQYDSTVWLRTFRDLATNGNQTEANYFAAMILALGFQNAPPEALNLVEECFERVHQVAWNDALPDETWLILDPIVPHLWWIHDWDKCERLRRGLIEAFVKFHWPVIKLADCVKNEAFLSKVIESAQKVDGGRELLSQKF